MHCRVPLHECRTPKLQVILDLKVDLTPNICGNGNEKLQNSTSFWIGVAIALQVLECVQCTAVYTFFFTHPPHGVKIKVESISGYHPRLFREPSWKYELPQGIGFKKKMKMLG